MLYWWPLGARGYQEIIDMKQGFGNRLKAFRASLAVCCALSGINPEIVVGFRKNRRGQTLPMVAVVSFVIVTIGLFIFFYLQILGGSKEVQNAVDAGTLQVSKKAMFAPRVQLTHSNAVSGLDEITEFGGVARNVKQLELDNFPTIVPSDDGQFYIDLLGINGVWGLALMEALNVQRMQMVGLATPAAIDHAKRIQQTASDISARLSQEITSDDDPTQADPGISKPLDTTFRKLANNNTVRMLEQTGNVRADDYANSFTYRGQDSNIQLNIDQQRISILDLNAVTSGKPYLGTTTPNGVFVKGYMPVTVPINGTPLDFMFVPLQVKKKPHLISQGQFNKDADPRTIDASSSINNATPPAIPPNAFHYSGLALIQKSGEDMSLKAFAASRDMTGGLVLQNTRGFIRIENKPGVGSSNLHVIDEANREVIAAFLQGGGPGGGTAHDVWIKSLFNPVETLYTDTMYSDDAVMAAGIACAVMCMLTGAAGTYGPDIPCLLAMFACFPLPPMICCLMCCATWAMISFSVTTPVYCGSGAPLSTEKPLYGFLPAVSQRGTGTVFNTCGDGQLARITPINESFHKIFYDWLDGDTNSELWLWIATYVLHGIIPLNAGHSGSVGSPHLNFPVADMESGMRDRIPPFPFNNPLSSFNISLLNGSSPANFTGDGTMFSLIGSRIADPNAKRVYDLLYQRVREISPLAPPAEVQGVIADSVKKIPMGKQAFIYYDDATRHLQLSVTPGDTLPAWLQQVRDETPDGVDASTVMQADFEYPLNHPNIDYCYRLVDPNAWGDPILFPQVAKNYPTRACNYDVYHFTPSSGYHGLLGVLQLGSKLEKKCLVHGNLNASAASWNQPQDCFCFPEMNSRINNGNCGSTMP